MSSRCKRISRSNVLFFPPSMPGMMSAYAVSQNERRTVCGSSEMELERTSPVSSEATIGQRHIRCEGCGCSSTRAYDALRKLAEVL